MSFIPNDWNRICSFYAAHAPAINATPRNDWAMDPYAWEDAGIRMTPIEAWLWTDIRAVDAIFYPQYPVAGVFVDFANPAAKVAIECDGKEFHDADKDAVRDAKLVAIGWTVYRFTGAECRQDFDISGCKTGATRKRIQQIALAYKLRRSM